MEAVQSWKQVVRMPDGKQWIVGGLPSAIETINLLIKHKKFAIGWTMFRLKVNPEPSHLADKRWKCIFKCDEAIAVCEGPTMRKAFHGAVAYFLALLRQKFDWVMNHQNWVCEWDAAKLCGSPVWEILRTYWRARGIPFRYQIWEYLDKLRNGKVYHCGIKIGSKIFMGGNASSVESAWLFAGEVAFQEIFQAPCPILNMYVGEKARTPLNLYSVVNIEDVIKEFEENQDDSLSGHQVFRAS